MTAVSQIVLLATSPDADEARRLAEHELSKSEYLAAQPNAFDRASLAVLEFLKDLLSPDSNGGAGGTFVLIGLAVIVVGLLVCGIILWGRPRASRRAQRHETLLGEHDQLSAHELRAKAEQSARAGHWNLAMTQRYRALARGLIERELLTPAPGATAQAIAVAASLAFPAEQQALLDAAARFDQVRYLGFSGDEQGYLAILAADERISESRIAVPA